MPTRTLGAIACPAWRRDWPEALLSVLALVIFLGCLGSVDVWGKREQRATAEAIDTIDHQHWLVAEIQGRPRLEKPPLPRWLIATLMILTGRRDEWIVRLPSAACALATVALVYVLGLRMGGRAVGLSSALGLCSLVFFVVEMRQASNDGPLALFTTLTLFAAWHVLDDRGTDVFLARGDRVDERLAARLLPISTRTWGLVMYAALGLGILSKGPIILLLVATTVVPYLAFSRRFAWGLRRLANGWGMLLLAAMAASWPMAVLHEDPNALSVWLVEMSEKTGVLQTLPHHRHSLLAVQWPAMMFPWSLIAMAAVVLPFLSESPGCGDVGTDGVMRRGDASPIWFAWWWGVGNLGIFCLWAIAKPNYYVPCMPGMALLIGAAWVRLGQEARGSERRARAALVILRSQRVMLLLASAVAPIVAYQWLPRTVWPWSLIVAAGFAIAVVAERYHWRRGDDVSSMATVTTAGALAALIAYGILAPAEDSRRGYREVARVLRQLVPNDVRTLHFFSEIDEGLWFYLTETILVPVPGTQRRYSKAYDLVDAYHTRSVPSESLEDLDIRRQADDRHALLEWLDHGQIITPYLLIRSNRYDRLAPELSGRVTLLFREARLDGDGVILLHVDGRGPVATDSYPIRR